MPDRIEETLAALRTDVDRLPVADSGSVRRRGQQRTRNQVLGSALATVAVVAAAVGIGGGLLGDERTSAPPATDPTVRTTPDAQFRLAADPLFRPADLGQIGPYENWQRNDDAAAIAQQPPLQRCVGDVTALTPEATSALFYTDLDPTVLATAIEFESSEAAEQAASSTAASLRDCPEGPASEATVTDREGALDLPRPTDEGVRLSRLTVPTADAGIGYYELAVLQRSNVVVVLQLNAMGNPVGDGAQDWVWTPDLAQTALDRATG